MKLWVRHKFWFTLTCFFYLLTLLFAIVPYLMFRVRAQIYREDWQETPDLELFGVVIMTSRRWDKIHNLELLALSVEQSITKQLKHVDQEEADVRSKRQGVSDVVE
jgi:hypothetical protein